MQQFPALVRFANWWSPAKESVTPSGLSIPERSSRVSSIS